MTMQRLLRHTLIALAALAAVPAAVGAAPTKTGARKTGVSVRLHSVNLKYDKKAARRLHGTVGSSTAFEALTAALRGEARSAAVRHLRDVARFYAVSPRDKARVWNQILTDLVKRKKITARDKRALGLVLIDPNKTLRTWKPQTAFGVAVLDQATSEGPGPVTANSNAGNAGVIIGAIIGGLGGSPVSVGIGAAIGKLAGEGANAAAIYAYNLAPPQTQASGSGGGVGDDGRQDGGDDSSSDDGGDGDGDGDGGGGGGQGEGGDGQ